MATSNGQALTLDRGLKVLLLLAATEESVTVSNLAAELGLHRQAVYRLLGTLEQHGLAVKARAGGYRLGLATIGLAGAALRRLDTSIRPVLRDLADTCSATSVLMLDDRVEAVAALVVEPTHTAFHLSLREGSRHSLTRGGASGLAVLAARPETPDDAADVRQTRRKGVAVSRGQVTKGGLGVAAPVHLHSGAGVAASIGVITASEGADVERIAAEVTSAALGVSVTF